MRRRRAHNVTLDVLGAEEAGAASASVAAHEAAHDHTKLHTQGTDAGLDTGGPNAVTAATITAHHASTANPHSVTAAQAGADPAGTAAAEVATHNVANRHVDHSAVQVATSATSGLNGGGDLTATRNLVLDANRLTAGAALNFVNDRLVYYEDAGATTKKIAPAKLINDPGTTVTDIWSGSKITAQLAGKAPTIHTHAASEVTSGTFADARIAASNVTQHQASINHNALSNYVADQHVAHSGVSISTPAASGLSGGGTIAATRSLALDINGMTLGVAVDTVNDRVAIYDDDVAAHRKVSVNLLIAALNASNLVSGTVPAARIATVNASVVTAHTEALMENAEFSGSSFPATAGRTAPFFHTTHREWFSWDSTNSVWLGELKFVDFARSGSGINNLTLHFGNANTSSSTGLVIPHDIAIVGMTGSWNTTITTGNFRVQRDGSSIVSVDIAVHGANTGFSVMTLYGAFNATSTGADGTMAVLLDTLSAAIAQPKVRVFYRRRAT